MSIQVEIVVRGSTSNLGPGFDVIGLALDIPLKVSALLSRLPCYQDLNGASCSSDLEEVEESVRFQYTQRAPFVKKQDEDEDDDDDDESEEDESDEESEDESEDEDDDEVHVGEDLSGNIRENLMLKTADAIARSFDRRIDWSAVRAVVVDNRIPLSRGLGSSASAVVAGCELADVLADLKMTEDQKTRICCGFEGHPDNTTPSLVGGCVACIHMPAPTAPIATSPTAASSTAIVLPDPSPRVLFSRLRLHSAIRIGVVIPDMRLSTALARAAIPKQLPLADVIYNLQRCTALSTALASPMMNLELLRECLRDSVHQPYRQNLVPGLAAALALSPASFRSESDSGEWFLACCISGAGPSVLLFVYEQEEAKARRCVAKAGERVCGIFRENGIAAQFVPCKVFPGGPEVSVTGAARPTA